MDDWKFFEVFWFAGPPWMARLWCMTVILDAAPDRVYASMPLTPRLARLAALKAVGQDSGVWVFSSDETGYALYPRSQRELTREDLNKYTVEVWEGVEA